MPFEAIEDELPSIAEELPKCASAYEEAASSYFEERVSEPILQTSALLEELTRSLCHDADIDEAGDDEQRTFFELIETARESSRLPGEIASSLHYVRVLGNKVRHGDQRMDLQPFDARTCLRIAYRVMIWHLVEDDHGPDMSRDAFESVWRPDDGDRPAFDELRRLVEDLAGESPVRESILRHLLHQEECTVDDLVNELNLSRLAVLRALTGLMEHDVVVWKSAGSEVLQLARQPYNLRYAIRETVGSP